MVIPASNVFGEVLPNRFPKFLTFVRTDVIIIVSGVSTVNSE